MTQNIIAVSNAVTNRIKVDFKDGYILSVVTILLLRQHLPTLFASAMVLKAIIDAVLITQIFNYNSKINSCLFSALVLSYIYPIFNISIFFMPVMFYLVMKLHPLTVRIKRSVCNFFDE